MVEVPHALQMQHCEKATMQCYYAVLCELRIRQSITLHEHPCNRANRGRLRRLRELCLQHPILVQEHPCNRACRGCLTAWPTACATLYLDKSQEPVKETDRIHSGPVAYPSIASYSITERNIIQLSLTEHDVT